MTNLVVFVIVTKLWVLFTILVKCSAIRYFSKTMSHFSYNDSYILGSYILNSKEKEDKIVKIQKIAHIDLKIFIQSFKIMSKILEIYKELKKEDEKTIYLFKSGIFMIAIAEDAEFLSQKFNFKKTMLNDYTVKCGFPLNSANKYISILNNFSVPLKVIDVQNNTAASVKDFSQNEKMINIFKTISKLDLENLSISEAYSILDDLKKEAINLIGDDNNEAS